ncbi:MAG: c-type cytochrome domain-containing protein [Gemmataceae bacterium]
MKTATLSGCFLLALGCLLNASQAVSAEDVSYAEVQAILKARCLVCHSGNVKKGDLDLGSYDGLMKGGRRGPALVAGKSADSLLFKLISKVDKPSMPPRKEDPLNEAQVAIIQKWIDQGARPSSTPQTADRTGVRVPAATVQFVRALALGTDFIAVARANQVVLHDLKTGTPRRPLVDPRLQDKEGKAVAAAHLGVVESLALDPTGKLLASGSFREAVVWDPAGGAIKHRLTGFADRVVALAFSRDGKLLAVGGGTPTVAGTIDLFDTASGSKVSSIPQAHTDTVLGLCFSPDGKNIASAGADLAVRIHEVATGKFLKKLEGHSHHVLDVSWSGDGKFLASAGIDKQIRFWDVATGEELKRINRGGGQLTIMSVKHDEPPCRVRFIGDGRQLVSAGAQQPVRILLLEEITKASNYYTPYFQPKQLRSFGGTDDYLYAVDVSADGNLVAAGGENGVVYLYDAQKGTLIYRIAD